MDFIENQQFLIGRQCSGEKKFPIREIIPGKVGWVRRFGIVQQAERESRLPHLTRTAKEDHLFLKIRQQNGQ